MTTGVIEKFLNHLKYLGYDIEEEDTGRFSAKHERLFNMCISVKAGGIFFGAWVGGNEIAETHRQEFIERLNYLNGKAVVLRFHADEDSDLMMEAWYPKRYDRVSFAAFMDLLSRDSQLLFSDDYGVEKYCG